MVEADEGDTGQTAGGYAKEMSEDYKRRQAELIADHIKEQDIVITTALIPGRPAPILVNDDMIASMKPGSVIVDIAAEQGGNVSQTKPGEITVTAMASRFWPSTTCRRVWRQIRRRCIRET